MLHGAKRMYRVGRRDHCRWTHISPECRQAGDNKQQRHKNRRYPCSEPRRRAGPVGGKICELLRQRSSKKYRRKHSKQIGVADDRLKCNSQAP